MKVLIEVLLSLFLHPVAMVLMWINVLARRDLGFFRKFLWILVSLVWGIGPLVYIFLGGGDLW